MNGFLGGSTGSNCIIVVPILCKQPLYIIINIGKSNLLTSATKTNWLPQWIYYASNAYISAKMETFTLMKVYLWTTTDSKTRQTFKGRQKHRQGTKPASGKIENFSYSYSYSGQKVHSTIAHWWLYSSINSTNELCLLVSMAFWVKKNQRKDKLVQKETVYELELVCSFFATTITSYKGLDSIILHSLVQIT